MDAPAARATWSGHSGTVSAALETLDVKFVLVERGWLRSLAAPVPALATEAFQRGHLRLVYSDRFALFYEVGAPLSRLRPGGR